MCVGGREGGRACRHSKAATCARTNPPPVEGREGGRMTGGFRTASGNGGQRCRLIAISDNTHFASTSKGGRGSAKKRKPRSKDGESERVADVILRANRPNRGGRGHV